jgi:chromosome partitioning protein
MKIAIINQKGGVGKTTTAINLSSRFAKMEYKTLLIDLDSQANAAYGLKIQDISEEIKIVNSNFHLFSKSDFKEENELDRRLNLNAYGSYDYIIFDCPPVFDMPAVNAIKACEFIIIPVLSGDYYSILGLKDIFKTIQGVKSVPYKVLITNVNERLAITKHFSKMVIEKITENKVFKNWIRIDSKIKEAPFAGLPIDLYDNNSKGSIDYGNLALEILNLNI